MKPDAGRAAGKERILQTIGLSYRASLLTSGFDAIEMALHAGAVELLIVAVDGSEKQRAKLMRIAQEEDTRCRTFGTAEELGRAIGKDMRIAVAILDQGMADKLILRIDELKKNDDSDKISE
ncbi:MAG: ribosomal L7Ae/L30e/S12e/Gadd45 family protein [Clostridiales bacterium]|nr:ribosomal L7Ae/L30e/S12e/Gadd45 family protein [Clostridiales bacterium]MBR5974195.1 ribosomal L7Ae/L30e/S12e/Gadd45 family protein [Clostridiales bacterium]